jgi:predicted AAA+ superfamily ATPase
MADEWPTLGEELGRKAMERIASSVDRYQANPTPAEARLLWHVADILSEVTQGLIPNETWNIIYAVRQEMDKIRKAAVTSR